MAIAPRKLKTGAQVRGKLTLPDESSSKALTINSTGGVTSSVTTDTELSYVSGVTSSIQTQLNTNSTAASTAQTNVNNLVTLSGVPVNSTNLGTFTGTIIDDGSTIKEAIQDLESFIQALPDPMEYKGTWDASTNTPTLTDGTGDNGDVYQVTVAGTQFTPSITFAAGDKVVYNGATGKYEKWDMTESVPSVFGRVGPITAQSGDYTTAQVTEDTNLYFTDTRARTAAVVNSTAGTEINQAPSVSAVKSYVAAQGFLKADGSVLLTADLDANSNKIINLATPTDPADAVTKAYVDAAVGNAGSPGDLSQGTFSIANNQSSSASVTGFAFANASVRSFRALVSVAISATTPAFEQFQLDAIQKGSSWELSYESTGDESGITFDVDSSGQVTYQSANLAGFTSGTLKYRAEVTNL